jgi:hypothetical protein
LDGRHRRLRDFDQQHLHAVRQHNLKRFDGGNGAGVEKKQ